MVKFDQGDLNMNGRGKVGFLMPKDDDDSGQVSQEDIDQNSQTHFI